MKEKKHKEEQEEDEDSCPLSLNWPGLPGGLQQIQLWPGEDSPSHPADWGPDMCKKTTQRTVSEVARTQIYNHCGINKVYIFEFYCC